MWYLHTHICKLDKISECSFDCCGKRYFECCLLLDAQHAQLGLTNQKGNMFTKLVSDLLASTIKLGEFEINLEMASGLIFSLWQVLACFVYRPRLHFPVNKLIQTQVDLPVISHSTTKGSLPRAQTSVREIRITTHFHY